MPTSSAMTTPKNTNNRAGSTPAFLGNPRPPTMAVTIGENTSTAMTPAATVRSTGRRTPIRRRTPNANTGLMIRAAPTDSNGTSTAVMALSRPRALARPGLSLRSWPSRPAASRSGLDGAQRCRPRDDMRAADREQNPLVTEGKLGPMRERCCHMPPRVGCALSATEVQSSLEESQSRLHAGKRAHLPDSDATPHPQDGTSAPGRRGGAAPGWLPL